MDVLSFWGMEANCRFWDFEYNRGCCGRRRLVGCWCIPICSFFFFFFSQINHHHLGPAQELIFFIFSVQAAQGLNGNNWFPPIVLVRAWLGGARQSPLAAYCFYIIYYTRNRYCPFRRQRLQLIVGWAFKYLSLPNFISISYKSCLLFFFYNFWTNQKKNRIMSLR